MQALYRTLYRVEPYTVQIVEPVGSFLPSNWQTRPELFRVLQTLTFRFRGEADSERFLFNQKSLGSGTVSRWAVSG